MLFLYALKAPATRDKYIQRLMKFLDFLCHSDSSGLFFEGFSAGTLWDQLKNSSKYIQHSLEGKKRYDSPKKDVSHMISPI
jgi:hypothetical protein